MKIGIITFHWGTNHGAVLQAYALSEYLRTQYGAQVEIINYCPEKLEINAKNTFRLRNAKKIIQKIQELRKETKIKPFRNNLRLSRRYYSNDQLIRADLLYDILITGSDQIWNPAFLKIGEGTVTPVYFLNFGKADAKKISVSASFGCTSLPTDCQEIILPLLKEFQEISVREETGKDILEHMGLCGVVTADPTALLTTEQYVGLCSTPNMVQNDMVSKMILRRQSKETSRVIRMLCQHYSSGKIVDINRYSIPDWLSAIRNSKMVITNSFHCVMMCLKLHTPFAVVLEDGQKSGMNDRFQTLLNMFGLTDRVVQSSKDVDRIPVTMDFDRIDAVMERYAESLKLFLDRNIL